MGKFTLSLIPALEGHPSLNPSPSKGRETEVAGALSKGRERIKAPSPRPSPTRAVGIEDYYRLEAGRFEDFVSYGLKSFAHEGVT